MAPATLECSAVHGSRDAPLFEDGRRQSGLPLRLPRPKQRTLKSLVSLELQELGQPASARVPSAGQRDECRRPGTLAGTSGLQGCPTDATDGIHSSSLMRRCPSSALLPSTRAATANPCVLVERTLVLIPLFRLYPRAVLRRAAALCALQLIPTFIPCKSSPTLLSPSRRRRGNRLVFSSSLVCAVLFSCSSTSRLDHPCDCGSSKEGG